MTKRQMIEKILVDFCKTQDKEIRTEIFIHHDSTIEKFARSWGKNYITYVFNKLQSGEINPAQAINNLISIDMGWLY